jgi:hypothetical protein
MTHFQNQLKLIPSNWYAWQMIPGYIRGRNIPYCSPVFVEKVIPRKTGKSTLGLRFTNVLYAEGVQEFELDIKILKHAGNYIVAELISGKDSPDRCVVISHIEFGWIERFCPTLWFYRPPSSVSVPAQGSVSIV